MKIKKILLWILLFMVLFFIIYLIKGFFLYKKAFTIDSSKSVIFEKYKGELVGSNVNKSNGVDLIFQDDGLLLDSMPYRNKDIVNILVLGIRGESDPNGGTLSDTILLVSYNIRTKKTKITIIPRDLFIYIPGFGKREKINFVYAYGYERGGKKEGVAFSRQFFSRIMDTSIDNVVVVDFDLFLRLVDLLGGVDVNLSEDFIEDKQWGCDQYGRNCQIFHLPKGINHLDGQTALLLVRSRFNSSDFARQQRSVKLIQAVIEKAKNLGLNDIVKIIQVYNVLADHIRTDMGIGQVKYYYDLIGKDFDFTNIKILTLLPDNKAILETTIDGQYVLLPIKDNFNNLRENIKNIY